MKTNRIFIVIGSFNTVACLQNAFGMKISLISRRTKGFFGGVISDRTKFQLFIDEICQELEVNNNSSATDVFLSFDGRYIFTDIVQIPLGFSVPKVFDNIVEKKVQQICKKWCVDRKRYLLLNNPVEIFLDETNVAEYIGLKGNKLNISMQILSADTIIVDNIIEIFKKLFLNIVEIVPTSYLFGNIITNNDLKELGMLLIDFGASSVNITAFYKGKLLFTERINQGGEQLTRKIAQNLNITLDEAERLKCIYGAACFGPRCL